MSWSNWSRPTRIGGSDPKLGVNGLSLGTIKSTGSDYRSIAKDCKSSICFTFSRRVEADTRRLRPAMLSHHEKLQAALAVGSGPAQPHFVDSFPCPVASSRWDRGREVDDNREAVGAAVQAKRPGHSQRPETVNASRQPLPASTEPFERNQHLMGIGPGRAGDQALPAGLAPRPPPQPSRPKPTHQLAAVGRHRTGRQGPVPVGLVHVVVIALKADPAQTDGLGQLMQLVVARIADQVSPAPAPPRPPGLVHQHSHPGHRNHRPARSSPGVPPSANSRRPGQQAPAAAQARGLGERRRLEWSVAAAYP